MRSVNVSVQVIAEAVEQFVRVAGRVPADDTGLGRGVHLYDSGYLDSLGAIRLLEFVEGEFEIQLSDEVLADPGFATIDAISAAVAAACRARLVLPP